MRTVERLLVERVVSGMGLAGVVARCADREVLKATWTRGQYEG